MAKFRLSFLVPNLSYTEERERTTLVTDAPDAEAVEEMHQTLMPESEITDLAPATSEDKHPEVSYRSFKQVYRHR